MKLVETMMCVPAIKLRMIDSHEEFTNQELMNRPEYDNINDFDVTLTTDNKNTWVITKSGKYFAYSL